MKKPLHLSAIIPSEFAGKRLDQALAAIFPEHSRSRLQGWIRNGEVLLDGQVARQRHRITGGESVQVSTTLTPRQSWDAEAIPLNIIHEDEQLLIINKPAGLIVHPGAGNPQHTLLNALLHHDPQLQLVPRAGIVHRLDKDTSGIMVVARTPETHTALVSELQQRTVKREYQAIVTGVMTAGGTVDKPIGRHPRKRVQMAVVDNGKDAVTHFRVINRFRAHTHICVTLETGRTHQIRVHMAWLKFPLVGDPVYAGHARSPGGISPTLLEKLRSFPRQALHASALTLVHPGTGKKVSFHTPLPDDMQALLVALREDMDA